MGLVIESWEWRHQLGEWIYLEQNKCSNLAIVGSLCRHIRKWDRDDRWKFDCQAKQFEIHYLGSVTHQKDMLWSAPWLNLVAVWHYKEVGGWGKREAITTPPAVVIKDRLMAGEGSEKKCEFNLLCREWLIKYDNRWIKGLQEKQNSGSKL